MYDNVLTITFHVVFTTHTHTHTLAQSHIPTHTHTHTHTHKYITHTHKYITHTHTNNMCSYFPNLISIKVSDIEDGDTLEEQDDT